jgi:hypothetical protein
VCLLRALQSNFAPAQLYKNSQDFTDMVGLSETAVLFSNVEILCQVNRLLLTMVRARLLTLGLQWRCSSLKTNTHH